MEMRQEGGWGGSGGRPPSGTFLGSSGFLSQAKLAQPPGQTTEAWTETPALLT